MAAIIPWIAVLGGLLLAAGIVIWSAWRARWCTGGLLLASATTLFLLGARAAGGARPAIYGPMLGIALFLAAAMIVMGVIAAALRLAEQLSPYSPAQALFSLAKKPWLAGHSSPVSVSRNACSSSF